MVLEKYNLTLSLPVLTAIFPGEPGLEEEDFA